MTDTTPPEISPYTLSLGCGFPSGHELTITGPRHPSVPFRVEIENYGNVLSQAIRLVTELYVQEQP